MKKNLLFTIMLLELLLINAYASTLIPAEKFVYNRKGNCPIIISAPHAGAPRNIIPGVPLRIVRKQKGYKYSWDTNTHIAARLISKYLSKYGLKPYIIIARFNRRQIDANRRPSRAYDSSLAKPYYDYYHNTLDSYVKEVKEKYKTGFLLDIHGQKLKRDVIWRGTRDGRFIRKLLSKHGWDAVLGKYGIYGQLRKMGYKIYPADSYTREAPYRGGYISKKVSDVFALDAFLIEIGKNFRINKNKLRRFSKDFAKAVYIFYKHYYAE